MAMVDPALVQRLQKEVGELLQQAQIERRQQGLPPLEGEQEQQQARQFIAKVIRQHAADEIARGAGRPEDAFEEDLFAAIEATMYGAGPLHPLLTDDDVENININGCDEVWITKAGQQPYRGDPIAHSDEELIKLIQTLAAYTAMNSRPWDHANAELDLKLPTGARLSAVRGVSDRPAISIRVNRLEKPTLDGLVANATMTSAQADFCRALARARLNVMIGGGTNAGKTTFLRAIAAEVDPGERIITIEKTFELGLRENGNHPNCVAFEERQSNNEDHGAVTVRDLVRRTLRMDPDRVIVGEVLGPEIIDMLAAMSQGNDGSLSTIHCRSARGVFTRIAAYALKAPERLPYEATFRDIEGALDYVLYLSRDIQTGERRLETILEVSGDGDGGPPLSSEIFATTTPGGPASYTGNRPALIKELTAAGWIEPTTDGGW